MPAGVLAGLMPWVLGGLGLRVLAGLMARVPTGIPTCWCAAATVLASAVPPVAWAQEIPNVVPRPATDSLVQPLAGPDKLLDP